MKKVIDFISWALLPFAVAYFFKGLFGIPFLGALGIVLVLGLLVILVERPH